MIADLEYNGQTLSWIGFGKWKATSGLKGHQVPSEQCTTDAGPVPEGLYSSLLSSGGEAQDDGTNTCSLTPAWGFQTIRRGEAAENCESYWANWGYHRIRIEPADVATRNSCIKEGHHRSGFYLHDSIKGYSHGCIETEGTFFTMLRKFMSEQTRKKRLYLKVKYTGDSTYGGTKVNR